MLRGKSLLSKTALQIVAAALASIALLWVILAVSGSRARDDAVRLTQVRNQNLALVQHDRANSALRLLDQTLLALRDEYLRSGKPPDIEQRLAALQVDRRFVGIVSLIDPVGNVIATNNRTQHPNYSDRHYFQKHAADPTDQLLVGQPILGKVSGKWLISLTRRVTHPDGSFAGVIFLSLDPGLFTAEYEKIDLGPNSAMALIGLDGITRVRRNNGKVSYGEDIRASQLFLELPKAKSGSYIGKAASDGKVRAASYAVLQDYPLVVLVASSVDDVLKAQRPHEFLLVTLGVLGSLLIATLAGTLGYRKQRAQAAQALLAQSEARMRAIVEASPVPMGLHGSQQTITFVNAAFVSHYGYTHQDIPDVATWRLAAYPDPTYREMVIDIWHKAKEHVGQQGGTFGPTELRIRCKDGTDKTALVSVTFIAAGSVGEYLTVLFDVTEKVAAAHALERALQEKVGLLNEVHHRVKNNLQVISSLLRLEAGRSTHPAANAVLKDMQARIRSMALLHESLYRTGVFAQVELGAYLRQLATQAVRTMSDAKVPIRLELDLSPVVVGLDQATPCGLIVTELISNCFKHAFPAGVGEPSGSVGVLRVRLQPEPVVASEAAKVRLTISDTGVGLPADFLLNRSRSLGLQLVTDLARQIGGTFTVGSGPGAEFNVVFTPEVVHAK